MLDINYEMIRNTKIEEYLLDHNILELLYEDTNYVIFSCNDSRIYSYLAECPGFHQFIFEEPPLYIIFYKDELWFFHFNKNKFVDENGNKLDFNIFNHREVIQYFASIKNPLYFIPTINTKWLKDYTTYEIS